MPRMRPWWRVARTLADGLLRVLLRREVRGLERLPRAGGVILAANHGSFWDPPVLGATLPREFATMTRASFFGVPGFGSLIASLGAFPVGAGGSDRRAIVHAARLLREGGALLVFPEGGRMKDGRLHPGLPGLGLIAALARVPIVPIHVAGTNHIRRCIARREQVRIAIGEPLPWALWPSAGDPSTPSGRARHQAISDRVMQEIARLRDEDDRVQAKRSPPERARRGAISGERGGSR